MAEDRTETRLIAGLGNPGREYERTRHNIGFCVIDLLAEKLGSDVKKKKFLSHYGQCSFANKKLILLKPQQYMNRSGHPIATAAGFFKTGIENLLVITDDMALEPGVMRLRTKGSAGGHNGLADIIDHLNTENFARLRIGIGKSPYPDSRNYVLGRFGGDEAEVVGRACVNAVEAVLTWVKDGPQAAMTRFNGMNAE